MLARMKSQICLFDAFDVFCDAVKHHCAKPNLPFNHSTVHAHVTGIRNTLEVFKKISCSFFAGRYQF